MPSSPRRALRPRLSRAALAAVGTLVVSAVGVLGSSAPATSQTTVSPVEPGTPAVVRDGSVDITVDIAALHYYRSSANGTFAATVPSAHVFNTTTCRGDNPAGTNNSARTVVTVKGPDGGTVLTQTSPVRDMTTAGFFSNPAHKPLQPQPAPSNTNYRGDFPASSNTHHGMSIELDLTGKPAGEYTVTTSTRNTVKTGTFGACQVGTPGPGNTVVPGEVVETDTFVYRPWTHTFTDVLGAGRVRANVSPAEVEVTIDQSSSGVITGRQKFYSIDQATYALPSDPAACAANPSTCLPANAAECNPDAGCTPRLMIVNKPLSSASGQSQGLVGVFDLQTKAFIATAAVDGHQRLLMSLGPNDAYYHGILASLSSGLGGQGVDLMSILATEVEVRGATRMMSLSLLNGLQLDPNTDKGGVSIRTAGTAQAGILLDIYSHLRLTGGACLTNSASSANGDRSYTPNEDAGYTVRTSDVIPSVPKVGALGAIAGGPVYSIYGDFVGSTAPLINTASAVVGVDTAADEPNGYPVWVQPFLSAPSHVAAPRTMDYLGTATWSASETPILSGCLSVNFMVGTGAAIFDNPLSVGFKDLVAATGNGTPALREVQAAVDSAVAGVVDEVTANPTVASLLEDLVGALPLSTLP